MSSSTFEVGATVDGKYEVVERIGRGGMGTVVKVRRLEDDATVALKYCHLRDETSVRRFARETRTMKEIEHAHVVPILDMGLEHDAPYFVMPFAPETCADKLQEYRGDEEKALDAFLELCEGVRAIHGAGSVHRDVKPDNALLVDNRVVVSDLGLAKPIERKSTVLTGTYAVVGTEGYIAPEQFLPGGSRSADFRTDIYQLGKTLYKMLTGASPALLEMGKLSAGLVHIVRKATKEHPDERYQTVGELIDALKSYRAAQLPDSDPLAVFEDSLEHAKGLLSDGEYEESNIRRLLAVLGRPIIGGDAAQFLDLFDRVPRRLLATMCTVCPSELGEVMRAYVAALDEEVGGRPFAYAEAVARRAAAVFGALETTPELRSLAVEATLLAAVRLNRFAAMDELNNMLTSVEADDVALAVRDVLERRSGEYRVVCEQIAPLKLHPVIRRYRNTLANSDPG